MSAAIQTDFLVRQPCRVLYGLLNVLTFEVGISLDHLLPRRSVGYLADDHRHGNPHPTNARPPAHDVGIEWNPVEHGFVPHVMAISVEPANCY